jgi:transposase InsO family protein
MTISPIFTFAPVPLTNERSPLAHAAAIVRRRMADNPVVAVPRHRIRPPVESKVAEAVAA